MLSILKGVLCMKKINHILKQLLYPRLIIVIFCVPIATILLIYTFLYLKENHPLSYISYVLSAYALVILCIRVFYLIGDLKENIEQIIHQIPFVKRYFNDLSFKTHVSLYVSLGINVIYAILKFVSGLYYHSFWFGTLAVYYILLALMRFLLLRHVHKNTLGQNMHLELKKYRICGMILGLMNIASTGEVILVVSKNEGFEYAGYLIYIMAMYAFYSVISAVVNVVKYKKINSPVISASKMISLVSALVSMLSLETAMLAQFNTEKGPVFRQIMTGATGGSVCLIVLAMSLYMILHSTKEIQKYKIEIHH